VRIDSPSASFPNMDSYKRLLDYNERWVGERLRENPEYFSRLKDDQRPDYLWIGCSDSRVPAETVTGCQPGDLFVHRNVANLVIHTDINLLTVLNYAVEQLQVKHVIVCGHYGCGGVSAAMTTRSFGPLNRWLRNVRDVYEKHQGELGVIRDEEARLRRLVELNVIEQVNDLAKTWLIQKYWRREERPWLHGWVYDIHTGKLNELTLLTHQHKVDPIHRYDFTEE
jgi:carbonic anhydrase